MACYSDIIARQIEGASPVLLSVDVEDYYHYVSDGETVRERYGLPTTVEHNLTRLLALFDSLAVNATLFTLSSLAPRIAALLREAAAAGHEIASHGHSHARITGQTPTQFRDDIRRSKWILEDIAGVPILGYRAPTFSVTPRTMWALDILREVGFSYDSSVCPLRTFAYGIPEAPEQPHMLLNGLVEVPLSVAHVAGRRLMVSGGFYLRAYPLWLLRALIRRRDADLPLVLYIHPWEWADPQLNLWDLGVAHPELEWNKTLMKRVVTHARAKAFDRFSSLLAALPPGRPLATVLPR